MRSINKHLFKIIFALLVAITPAAAQPEPARLKLDKLDKLEAKASEVVEVNVEGRLLDLAKRILLKSDDPGSKDIAKAIEKLKAIYVRVYEFEKGAKYDMADVNEIRSQLTAPGWEKMINVRSKNDGEKIDVYSMFTGNDLSGLAVLVADEDSVTVVNVIGPIDIDSLADLSGKLNIPKLSLEDTSGKTKEKEKEKEKQKEKTKP